MTIHRQLGLKITADGVQRLIDKGNAVLETIDLTKDEESGYPALNSNLYDGWRAQSLNYLITSLGKENQYYLSFNQQVGKSSYVGNAERGLAFLSAIKDDIVHKVFDVSINNGDYLPIAINLFNRFHLVARQLRNRYDNRETLNVDDEYDVQNLLHCLLLIHFNDVRPEEWTPSYASRSSRMDFLLREHKVVIEVKKVRTSQHGKKIGDELIIDIARYEANKDCKVLLCFIYDPEGFIPNPRGFEADLKKDNIDFNVEVYIRPIV